ENSLIWAKIDKKANWFKINRIFNRHLEDISNDFKSFYINFISDSLNQQKKIDFNRLIGVLGECDTTILLNTHNWEYTNWNFLEHFDYQNNLDEYDDYAWNNTFFYSETTFFYEFILNGSGIIYQVGFEKI